MVRSHLAADIATEPLSCGHGWWIIRMLLGSPWPSTHFQIVLAIGNIGSDAISPYFLNHIDTSAALGRLIVLGFHNIKII